MKRFVRALAGSLLALGAAGAQAQGQVNIICSVPMTWCQAVGNAFTKETGITVGVQNKSSGEAMAQILAERANPKLDVYYTGTGDPHLQAAEMGLTEEYKSPQLPQLHEWAVKQAEAAKFRTVGVYSGALGIAYNPELLAKKKLPEPKCWADLANPIYKDEVQMANPELIRHGVRDARDVRPGVRRGQGVRAAQGHAQEHEQLPARRRRSGARGRARRDGDRRDVPA